MILCIFVLQLIVPNSFGIIQQYYPPYTSRFIINISGVLDLNESKLNQSILNFGFINWTNATGSFYPLNENPSNYITNAEETDQVWLADKIYYDNSSVSNQTYYLASGETRPIITTSDVKGVNGNFSDIGTFGNITTTGTGTFGDTLVGGATGVKFSAVDGLLTMTGQKSGGGNENLIWNFEYSPNVVRLTSSSGALFMLSPETQIAGAMRFLDDITLNIGNGYDGKITWTTTGNDNLQIGVGVGSAAQSGYVSLMNRLAIGNANRSPLALSSNPVFRVYSSDATNATDYIEFFHDQTTATIQAGDGAISFGDDNLTTTGNIKAGGLNITGNLTMGIFTFFQEGTTLMVTNGTNSVRII